MPEEVDLSAIAALLEQRVKEAESRLRAEITKENQNLKKQYESLSRSLERCEDDIQTLNRNDIKLKELIERIK